MDPEAMQAIQEAMRRRQGMPASGAGIPGGMPATMAPASPTAMAGAGMTPPPNQQPNPALPSDNPSQPAISAMNNAKPGEAEQIVKALIDRLKQHPPQGGLPA